MPLLTKEQYEAQKKTAHTGPASFKPKEPEKFSDGKIRTFEYSLEAIGEWDTANTKDGPQPIILVRVLSAEDADKELIGKEFTLWGSAKVLKSRLEGIAFKKGSKIKLTHLGKAENKRYNDYIIQQIV